MIPDRIRRVNSVVRTIVASAINDLIDTPDYVLVTVTKVDTARDLSQSKVYISVIPDEKKDEILSLVFRNGKKIQAALFDQMRTRKSPKLLFKIDNTPSEADKIENILKTIK